VRSFAAQDAANGDERVVLVSKSEFFCREGQFKCTWYVNYVYVVALGARAFEGIQRGGEQALSDETVETADRDGKTQAAGAEFAANS